MVKFFVKEAVTLKNAYIFFFLLSIIFENPTKLCASQETLIVVLNFSAVFNGFSLAVTK